MGPFRRGTLSASDADRLNELWRFKDAHERLFVEGPLALSREAGIPVIKGVPPPEVYLCEVVSNDGATPPAHTVKRKTRAPGSNAPFDHFTLSLFKNVLNPQQVALA